MSKQNIRDWMESEWSQKMGSKMKVELIQAQEAKFSSVFRWWSEWVDICIYDFECTPFLLQMSVSRTNKKKFRKTRISGSYAYRQVRWCKARQIRA